MEMQYMKKFKKEMNPLTQYNRTKPGTKKIYANITVQEVLDKFEEHIIDKDNLEMKEDNLSKYNRNNNKRQQLKMMNHYFFDLLDVPIISIDRYNLHKWAEDYMRSRNIKAASINRAISGLRGMLHWAADTGVIDEYRLNNYKQLTDGSENDSHERRCLSPTEIKNLKTALNNREIHKRTTRDSYNNYLQIHHMQLSPEYPKLGEGYADYVYPMIMTSLLTGGRKGSVRALKWKDVDFEKSYIRFQGENSKAGNTIVVPH